MVDPTIGTIICGLGCALTWGAGDFSGGMAAKKGDVFVVILVSQLIGLTALFTAAVVLHESLPPMNRLAYGAAAGIAGMFGILWLYTGLAEGRMGIVAPVSAVVTAVLPVMAAFYQEGFPGSFKLLGFAVAFFAVWLLSREDNPAPARAREWRLALCAGVGFGLFFILIERASPETVLWPLVAARISAVTLMAGVVLRRWGGQPAGTLPWVPIVFAGILDAAGNVLFAMAAQMGRLDIAAVVGSLYPATTVLLARTVLKERLRPRQVMGLGAAVTAVIMISL
jgi:drug/metabolite transporter (DMT)-like permease